MQHRFRQFPTPYDAWWHHRRRLRTARLCGLLTALLLPGLAALLHGFPHHAVWQSEGDAARFIAVTYAEPETETEAGPTVPTRARRIIRAPQAPLPAVLALFNDEILPTPTEEVSADLPQEDALAARDIDVSFEEEEAQPAPRTAAPQRPRRGIASAAHAAVFPAKRTPPAYRDAPKPPYPAELRARRIGGSVGVRIAVSAEGEPTEVTILSPSGHAELDRNTRTWILTRWRFRPAEADGKPIAAHVQTRVDYVPD